LCGLGGRTIEEAQRNISYEEFTSWLAYRNRRGSLHVGMRVENSMAVIALMIANRYRSENTPAYSIYDFAPYLDEPELTVDDLKGWE
jgi:hypothetical protein